MICSKCKKEIGNAAVCPYCGAAMFKEPLPHHLPVGTLIGGRFRVEGVLGEGGFGITYLTRDNKLGLLFAVKEYYPRGISYRSNTGTNEVYVSTKDDAAFYEHGKQRFLSEARTLARFSEEPGVVSVTDYIEENNTVYLMMEYLRGETLQQYLKEHGVLSADEAFSMLEPVMRTLEKIHANGVIHRDISPDNIMVLKNGQLKLMDFGAAKEFVDESRSMSVMLKKGFAPMEQYRRNGRQGPWTDVYALCATIYRCIAGRIPDDALDRVVQDDLQRPSQLGARITPAQEEVLMKGLAVHQNDRFQTVTELFRLWGSANQSVASQKMPVPSPQPVQQKAKTNKMDYDDPNATVFAEPAPIAKEPEPFRQEPTEKNKGKMATIISAVAAILAVAIIAGILIWKPYDTIEKNKESDSIAETEVLNTQPPADVEPISGKKWSGITAIAVGDEYTVGLKKDGTVVATGDDYNGECEVDSWRDITAISAGWRHTVGLKKDGTVVATGWNSYGQCDVDSWTDIIAISAGSGHTVGLKKDGTVVTTGLNDKGQCNVDSWTDIIAISAGSSYTVGLKKNGTVVATKFTHDEVEYNDEVYVLNLGQCNVDSWTDIISISAGQYHTIGLKKDGTVVATGSNGLDECDVDSWTDITAISVGRFHTVGLKKDGTVVATGSNEYGQCDVGNWTDITAVCAGEFHTVGLKNDGTVVSVGSGQGVMID